LLTGFDGIRLDDCESAFESHREFLQESFTARRQTIRLGAAEKKRTD
jgi:hypothetical protein